MMAQGHVWRRKCEMNNEVAQSNFEAWNEAMTGLSHDDTSVGISVKPFCRTSLRAWIRNASRLLNLTPQTPNRLSFEWIIPQLPQTESLQLQIRRRRMIVSISFKRCLSQVWQILTMLNRLQESSMRLIKRTCWTVSGDFIVKIKTCQYLCHMDTVN